MPPDLPAGAPNALYPDGGNNPAGHIEQMKDPATGLPKAAPVAAPAPSSPPSPESPAPASPEPSAEPPAPPSEAAPVEGEAKPEEPAPVDVSAYADLKLPETLTPNEPLFNEFKALAAELKLAPKDAEKLLPFAEKLAKGQVEALQSAIAESAKQQREAWIGEIKSMPEFQGEAYERNTTFLARLMDEFGSPQAKDYLNATGAGDNPHLVRMILKMGEALIEGEPTPLGDPGSLAAPKQDGKTGPKTAGSILYPNMNQPN